MATHARSESSPHPTPHGVAASTPNSSIQRTWMIHSQLHIRLHRFAHMIASNVPALGQAQHLECGSKATRGTRSGAAHVSRPEAVCSTGTRYWIATEATAAALWLPCATGNQRSKVVHSAATLERTGGHPTCLSVSRSALFRSAVSTSSRNWPTTQAGSGREGQARVRSEHSAVQRYVHAGSGVCMQAAVCAC